MGVLTAVGANVEPSEGAGAGGSRARAYFVACAAGAIAGETVASAGVIFAMAALPARGFRYTAAALLFLGFVGGASAGAVLLRRWYRRNAGAKGG